MGALLVNGQSRKEKEWKTFSRMGQELFQKAADEQWEKSIQNEAAETLSPSESNEVDNKLRAEGRADYIMSGRRVLTDENDPIRTSENALPLKANARLVVHSGHPGRCGDRANVRVDAQCATTKSEAICCQLAASNPEWFLQGEFYERELSLRPPRHGPGLPGVQAGSLVCIRKGIFGLPMAPRLWYLEMVNSALELGLDPSGSDPGFMVLHDDRKGERSAETLCGGVACMWTTLCGLGVRR